MNYFNVLADFVDLNDMHMMLPYPGDSFVSYNENGVVYQALTDGVLDGEITLTGSDIVWEDVFETPELPVWISGSIASITVKDPDGNVAFSYSGHFDISPDFVENPDITFFGGKYEDVFGGNDTIIGNDGDQTFRGYGGNDVLIGAGGDDYLLGGEGDDTFVFGNDHGHDRIGDFRVSGNDVIDLQELNLPNFDNISWWQSTDGTMIETGSGTVLVEQFLASDVSSGMFLL
ncbi:hypothetical protein [Pseudovibrio sp. WM33]|uniref:hypothetical protein n=1 Tax=Pseudovibrio sp. WM33 TaxID=1735585 RepID=UPI0007AE7D20|nr:hypothetical protein [Pseudovibrio sp. WM33]KZL22319.1 Leukotoxin [Pseudovibrio sp. WM33]